MSNTLQRLGSMPVAREIYQEGLIIPPVRLVRRAARQGEIRLRSGKRLHCLFARWTQPGAPDSVHPASGLEC